MKNNTQDNKSFSDYPSIERLFQGLESKDTDELVDRLKDLNVNLETCNSLIEEISDRKGLTPYKDYSSTFTMLVLAAFYVLSINAKSFIGTSIMQFVYLIIVGGFGFYLQYKVLPSHDDNNYLKALRIYQRYLMMGNKNS